MTVKAADVEKILVNTLYQVSKNHLNLGEAMDRSCEDRNSPEYQSAIAYVIGEFHEQLSLREILHRAIDKVHRQVVRDMVNG